MCLLKSIFYIVCIGLLLNQISSGRKSQRKYHGRSMNGRIPPVVEPTEDELSDNITQFNCAVCYSGHTIGSCVILASSYVLTTCQSIYKVVSPDMIIFDEVEVRWGVFRGELDGIIIMTTRATNVYPCPECFSLTQEFSPSGDLAIIQTTHEITFNAYLGFVSLPPSTDFARCNLINRYLFLSNFKMLDVATSIAESIWMVKTALIGPEICAEILDEKVYSPRNNICTSYAHYGGPDNCTADFGSALSYDNMLCGLLSHKRGCGGEHNVAGFVSISRHVPWIQHIVWSSHKKRRAPIKAKALITKT